MGLNPTDDRTAREAPQPRQKCIISRQSALDSSRRRRDRRYSAFVPRAPQSVHYNIAPGIMYDKWAS